MYRVRGDDQNEYGPVSADVVRDWFRKRRLVAASLVQREGSAEWKPLSEFPEFVELLVEPVNSGPPPIPLSSRKPPETSRLAKSSFILGILGFVTCGLTAVVGLILGIISTIKISRDPGRFKGKGLAIAGIILSSMALICVAMSPIFFKKFRAKAESASCIVNLKQISLAARMYSMDHNGVFPSSFLVMSNGLAHPKVLICNADFGKSRADEWSQVGSRNISYDYLVPGRKEAEIAQSPAFRCPVHGHVVLGDGSIGPSVHRSAPLKRKPE
jgi:hypothetical protein